MKVTLLITAIAFLSLSLHVSLEHAGAGCNGFAAVPDTHHVDDDAAGERYDREHPNHTPPNQDSDSHQHDPALTQLKTKSLAKHSQYASPATVFLAHSTEQETYHRAESYEYLPPRASIYLSTQTLLL